MVNERQRLRSTEKSNQQSTSFCLQMKRYVVRWCWYHFRAPGPSRAIVQENSHSATTQNEYLSRQSKQIDPKNGLTMTVNTGRLRQAINNQRSFADTSDHEGQEYVSFIVIAARQDEISCKKVLHANRTRLTKLTVF